MGLTREAHKVTLYKQLGTEVDVVNAARVSFDVEHEALTLSDEKLIWYLAEHHHFAPFRHVFLSMVVEMPIAMARQIMKHTIGNPMNEVSGRYVSFSGDIFVPSAWRKPAKTNKQGSVDAGDEIDHESVTQQFTKFAENCESFYAHLLQLGVCKEQARFALPLSLKTKVKMTPSLEALAHLVKLRTHSHAQLETQRIAQDISKIAQEAFPISWAALMEHYPQPPLDTEDGDGYHEFVHGTRSTKFDSLIGRWIVFENGDEIAAVASEQDARALCHLATLMSKADESTRRKVSGQALDL